MSTPIRDAVDVTADHLARRGTRPHSLLVLQHGRTVAERRWAPWDDDEPMLVYSVSKTFTSAAVGLAVADGAFGYDDTLAGLWPEAAEQAGPRARAIRVRDALSMATGHSPAQAEELAAGLAWGRRPDGLETARSFLAVEPQADPGTAFAYNNLATWMVSQMVVRHTGTDVSRLLESRVLEPLGIGGRPWDRDLQGCPLGFSGLHITPAQLARFATLLLDDGIWQGRRLLPAEWMARHRTRQIGTEEQTEPDWRRGYGWQVWMSRHGYRLDGAFGQFALVLPEADAVVVATNETADTAQPVLEVIWEDLWPALRAGAEEAAAIERPDRRVLRTPVVEGSLDPSRSARGRLPEGDEVRLSPGGAGWDLTWRRPGGRSHTIAVGHGRWLRTRVVDEDGEMELAASGGQHDGTLEVRIAVVTSPHTLILSWAGGEMSQRWSAELLSPGGLFSLVRPAEGRR